MWVWEDGTMILRLTRTTAELVRESAAEWQTLEKLVRFGQRTTGPRTDEGRLRQIATEFRVPIGVEGVVLLRSQRGPRHADGAH